MKRLAAVGMTALLLVACGGRGGGGSEAPAPAPRPGPGPIPKPAPDSWGDLICQQMRNCPNEILNLDLKELVLFFRGKIDKQPPVAGDSPEELMFLCGKRIGRIWDDTFGGRLTVPADELTELFLQTVDPLTCGSREDLTAALNTYFQNTEEFRSENKN